MKKILSALVFVIVCGIFNFCSALSVDEASFVLQDKTASGYSSRYGKGERFGPFDMYVDLSAESGIWQYPSGQKSIVVTVFYYDSKKNQIITSQIAQTAFSTSYRPVVFEFIKDKSGKWGWRRFEWSHNDARKYVQSVSVKGFHVANDFYNTSNNQYPLSILQKIGEYIDLDSFPAI